MSEGGTLVGRLSLCSTLTPLQSKARGARDKGLKLQPSLLLFFPCLQLQLQELSYRYTVWADNVERINRLSAGNSNRGAASHTLGLTAHTDLTRDEFRARYLGAPMTPQDRLAHLQQPQQPSANTAAVEGWLRKAAGWLVHGPPHATQRHHQQAAVSKKQQKHWRYENVTAPTAVDWRKHQPPV